MNNIKFLLLDLDGTLIQFDTHLFIKRYLELIQTHFSNYHFAKSVPQWIMEGTEQMLSNDGSMTNKEKFLAYFQNKTGFSEQKIWEIFTQFYQTDFDHLIQITSPVQKAREFCEKSYQAGYRLIIATQPVFPEIAIMKRIKWAGLEDIPFQLITHIENMNACKPHQIYFRQLMKKLNTTGEFCLMVGNDVAMDLAAKNSHIRTFYLQNNRHQSPEKIENADHVGNFSDLASLLGFKL
jgi:FMN phosphatase YigB (HAD superfamily)